MARVLLLFDIDGTLLKTGGAGVRAMGLVARRLFGDHFSFEGVQLSGHLDPLIFAEAAVANGLDNHPSHHADFREGYLEQLSHELAANRNAVRTAPGIYQTLQLLRDRAAQRQDVVIGLLTGNYTQAVPIKLAAVGIEPSWFPITAFGDEAATRSDLVLLAMEKYQVAYGESVSPQKVIVIGDTPRDVACAQVHGCIAFAVATGSFSVADLHGVGANVVVDDLLDLSPLIQMIDRLTT